MKLETPFIAIMISSLFFLGLFTVFTTVADTNNQNYEEDLLRTQGNDTSLIDAFNKINDTKDKMDSVNEEFYNTTLPDTGSLFPFYSLSLQTGKNIYNSLTVFKDILNIIVEIVGIPQQIVLVLFGILSTVFVLLVIFILLGRSS